MTKENKQELMPCQAGCKHYHGGEIRHHKDCVYYPDSFTEMYDKLVEKTRHTPDIEQAIEALEELILHEEMGEVVMCMGAIECLEKIKQTLEKLKGNKKPEPIEGLSSAIIGLDTYQKWRTGNSDEMPMPKDISKWINTVLKSAKAFHELTSGE